MNGILYIVPTPIGNLGDITIRAIEVFKSVDLILAEDTRTTGVLLKHLDIKNKFMSFHIHNEHQRVNDIKNKLMDGQKIAICSDAGTPGIADPGFSLIRMCVENEINYEVLPGANAVTTALVSSGFPCDKFIFEGFIPHKKGKQTVIQSWMEEQRTIVFFDSPHRLVKTLTMMKDLMDETRQICVCRELTKMFEEKKRGSIEWVLDYYVNTPPKGEIVVVLAGKNYEK